jgi:3-dehydroquinate synthase
VVSDVDVLRTLSDRDWRSGLAEAFKVAAIRDAEFLLWLEAHAESLRGRNMAAMEWLVRRCAALHCRHIVTGGDPFESGNARPLDFGHWSAHRIEALSGFALRHGEAVAVGVALDLLYASRQGFVRRPEAEAVIRAMAACGLPVWDETLACVAADGAPAVLGGIEEFRRHLGGELRVTLPAPLGTSCEVTCLDRTVLAEAIGELRSLAAGIAGGPVP